MRIVFITICSLIPVFVFAQSTSVHFELNGRPSNLEIRDSLGKTQNPFARFIGEWTLKDDTWIQNWGNGTDTIKIPGHHTISSQINTENSLFSIIDGPEPNGHIFWSYNPNTKEVRHLSSFGTIRVGTGVGQFYRKDNLSLKVSFEGESPGTYRLYTYEWVNDNEYALNSIQFDENDHPTGLFYRGNFIRLKPNEEIEEKILAILKVLDDHQLPKEEQIEVYAENVIHMAPNNEVITNRKDLLTYLNQQKEYGYADMKHEVAEVSSHGDIIIMRGRVKGTFYPSNGEKEIAFLTKNLFVFTWDRGKLKISKVIYNSTPNN
ncbi:MAG: nuclear transport factor 2 family protein [Bacteroidota bacterium]